MINRIKHKWFYALISFLVLVCAYPPFLMVYKLEHPLFLGFMICIFCLTILFFQQWWLRLILLILGYFFTLYYYFPSGYSFGFSWMITLFSRLSKIVSSIFDGSLAYLPALAAMVFILLLIIALSLLIIHYEKWFFSYIVIVGYLFSLLLVNQLTIEWRIMIITSLMLIMYFHQRYQAYLQPRKRSQFFLLTSLFCFFLGLSSFYLPITYPNSKTFFLNHTLTVRNFLNTKGIYQRINNYGSASLSKTGFSENDQNLGGPVSNDSSILFTAEQTDEHYWRVETKSYYTGAGWESNSEETSSRTPIILSDTDYIGDFKNQTQTKLLFNTSDSYLPTPYGKVQVPLTDSSKIQIFEQKNRLNFIHRPKELTLTIEAPNYTIDDLTSIPIDASSSIQQDTQLPEDMPDRVGELALSLTESKSSLYDKVKAVEDYLKLNKSYRYSKTDAVYTPEKKDYVDHFLFDSKIGYCDNFSSAMIILLRSAGIPSRWAKGFSAGDVSEGSEGTKKYTIRNSHAHSWPEVYFQGFGWIPFEPTPGFETTNESISTRTSSSTSDLEESSTVNSLNTVSSREVQHSSESSSSTEIIENNPKKTNQDTTAQLVVILCILFVIGILVLVFYKHFFSLYFTFYPKLPIATYASCYVALLKKAEKILYRESNEPLLLYAQRFEKEFPQCHGTFIQLTILYEQTVYNNQAIDKNAHIISLKYMAKLLTSLKRNRENNS